MNNNRRNQLHEVITILKNEKDILNHILEDESDAMDNIALFFPGSNEISNMEENIDIIEEAVDSIEESIDLLKEIK